MSPEAEAQKVIAISLGKIASSRIQRGGPKLCKNLLVANLIHKARTLVEDPFQCCYPTYEQVRDVSNTIQSESLDSAAALAMNNESPDLTEVPCGDEMTPSSEYCPDNRLSPETPPFLPVVFNQCENKENDYVDDNSQNSVNLRLQSNPCFVVNPLKVPSRCLKRRNSCAERKPDFEIHRSPKRICEQRVSAYRRSNTIDLDLSTSESIEDVCETSYSDFSGDSMDVEHISTLVSAFSNSFKDFCCSTCTTADGDISLNQDKSSKTILWRANSAPDMVLCAQQATNVLKMRQQSFETSTAVLA